MSADQPHAIRFLDALPASARQQLESISSTREYPPGAVLFQEGSEHDDIYLIVTGTVRLEMLVRDRGRLPLMTLGPGDLLGWSPLFGGHPMTATAIALQAVRVICFDGQELRGLCETNHEVGYHVMRQLALVLSDRLLATRLQLLDLFHKDLPIQPAPRDPEC